MFRSLITLMLACLFAFVMIYVEGPGLMRDFELRNARLVPAPLARTGAPWRRQMATVAITSSASLGTTSPMGICR